MWIYIHFNYVSFHLFSIYLFDDKIPWSCVSDVSVPVSTLWCLDKLSFFQRGSYLAYFQEPLLAMVSCWSRFQPMHFLLHVFPQYSVPSCADAPIFPEMHPWIEFPGGEIPVNSWGHGARPWPKTLHPTVAVAAFSYTTRCVLVCSTKKIFH